MALPFLQKKMTRNTQNHGIDFNLHGEDYSLPLFLFVLLPEAARQHKATQEILSKWLKYNGMVLILHSFEEKHTDISYDQQQQDRYYQTNRAPVCTWLLYLYNRNESR